MTPPASNVTGTGSVTRWYDADGNLVGPFATLSLTEREAAMVWWALYRAYGNEDRAAELWAKFRAAVGEARFEEIVRAGSDVGREAPSFASIDSGPSWMMIADTGNALDWTKDEAEARGWIEELQGSSDERAAVMEFDDEGLCIRRLWPPEDSA